MSKRQVFSEDGTLKRCSKCSTMKPLDSFHPRKLKSGGFGFQSWCRTCAGAKALADMNARYENDPEWRAKKLARDREAGMARRATYRAEHPRVFLTPEERLANQRATGRKSAARPEAREGARAHNRNYRALKKANAEGEPITKEVWRAIVAEHGSKCAYCGVETIHLEMDHVVPLTRGGKHSIANIKPACRACNTSKNDQLLGAEWTPSTEPQAVLTVHGGRRAWKLTDAQVVEIRIRRAAGEKGRALAAEYGVNEQHITDIFKGRARTVKA